MQNAVVKLTALLQAKGIPESHGISHALSVLSNLDKALSASTFELKDD